MPLACIELTTFDYEKYIKACSSLSIVWYVWKPDNESNFRVDRYFPMRQSKEDQQKFAALYAWATRTDPDYSIRFRNMKREWYEKRQATGVESTPCNYFVEPACIL